jgi:flagellar L-ring protein precursor FlgH
MNSKYVLLLAIGMLVFTGCVTPPSISDYDATWPDEPEAAHTSSGSIYSVGHDVALFESAVAHRVGDTVTIRLAESTNASKSSTTATKKDSSVNYGPPTGLGTQITAGGAPIAFGMENSTDFKGSGSSAQSNKLEGQITVTVAKRMSNGNLLVRGQKWLTLNQGSEFVRIQGIIRPVDISPDNSIPSFKVADAVISYGGKGALAEASSPGMLSRFFNSKWMPF